MGLQQQEQQQQQQRVLDDILTLLAQYSKQVPINEYSKFLDELGCSIQQEKQSLRRKKKSHADKAYRAGTPSSSTQPNVKTRSQEPALLPLHHGSTNIPGLTTAVDERDPRSDEISSVQPSIPNGDSVVASGGTSTLPFGSEGESNVNRQENDLTPTNEVPQYPDGSLDSQRQTSNSNASNVSSGDRSVVLAGSSGEENPKNQEEELVPINEGKHIVPDTALALDSPIDLTTVSPEEELIPINKGKHIVPDNALALDSPIDLTTVSPEEELIPINEGKHRVPDNALALDSPIDLTTVSLEEELKAIIENYKVRFHQQHIAIDGGGFSSEVSPDEIEGFFDKFGPGKYLSNYNLMPLLFSFDWSKGTKVLHSNDVENPKWPLLNKSYDRVILPCCWDKHWTLFVVELVSGEIKHYDSLRTSWDQSVPRAVVSSIMQRVRDAAKGGSGFSIKSIECQKQRDTDCGVFMLYNAECVALNRNPLVEKVDGVELRCRYLQRLVDLECQTKAEIGMMGLVLPTKNRHFHRRWIPEAMIERETDEDIKMSDLDLSRDWMPSPYASNSVWIDVRESLKNHLSKSQPTRSEEEHRLRAEELLRMIHAIDCEEVREDWEQAIAQDAETEDKARADCNRSQLICKFVERNDARSFKDGVLSRIGKWVFALDIAYRIRQYRANPPPSKRPKAGIGDVGQGNAVTRAFRDFVKEAYPSLQDDEQHKEICKYRDWWKHGQVWICLAKPFGPEILLLIPCYPKKGRTTSNKQYLKIKAPEREYFVEALRQLRPDLSRRVQEVGRYHSILQRDMAGLGRRVIKSIDSVDL